LLVLALHMLFALCSSKTKTQSEFCFVLRQDKHIDYYIVLDLYGSNHMLATWLLMRDPEALWAGLILRACRKL